MEDVESRINTNLSLFEKIKEDKKSIEKLDLDFVDPRKLRSNIEKLQEMKRNVILCNNYDDYRLRVIELDQVMQ